MISESLENIKKESESLKKNYVNRNHSFHISANFCHLTRSMTSVQHAIDALRAGKPIILVDDESRENEGDLILSAEKVTSESIGEGKDRLITIKPR